ncbi:MAG: two-component system sensor histidine kinase NtrB [Candidatus Scalindua sp.]
MSENKFDSGELDHLNTLAAGLVHEIKNPLNAISINLQLLNEDLQDRNLERDTKMSNRVQLLQKEVYRLDSILSDFLRFAKKPVLHLEECDINEIIESVLDFIGPDAMQNSIRILKSFDTKLPKCYLDSNVIKQALLNVILNAQQAMPNGGELIVRTYQNGENIFIDITDTGVGIQKSKIDKIFQVYYSTKKTGTGLGLPTAKRIIEESKGTINIRSEDGKGSSFLIKLPVNSKSKEK